MRSEKCSVRILSLLYNNLGFPATDVQLLCNHKLKTGITEQTVLYTPVLLLYNNTSVFIQEVIAMIDEVTAGAKVKLREKISDSVPVGSIATVLYIDNLDNVFIEWVSNGRLTSFSKKNFKSLFDAAG